MFANFSAEEIFIFVICPAVLIVIGLIAVVDYFFLKPRRDLKFTYRIARNAILGRYGEEEKKGVKNGVEFEERWKEVAESRQGIVSDATPFHFVVTLEYADDCPTLKKDHHVIVAVARTELEVAYHIGGCYDRLKTNVEARHMSCRRLKFEVWKLGYPEPLFSVSEPLGVCG